MSSEKDLSVKEYAKVVLDELQKEEWNYPYLCKQFLSFGLALSNLAQSLPDDDYNEIIDLLKKRVHLFYIPFQTDPMERAEFAGEIGELEEKIRKVYNMELSVQ